MINGSNIRLPNGQFSTLVTPVDKDGVTQFVTPVDFNGNIISGGGGSPGGSDTQVQFNDAGAFGGDSGLTYNKTTDTLTAGSVSSTIFTALPANNTSAFVASGSSLTGANAQSLVNLSQTWNTTGSPTLIFANITDTASNISDSNLINLQINGNSRFRVGKSGLIWGFNGGGSSGNILQIGTNGTQRQQFTNSTFELGSGVTLGWTSGSSPSINATIDLALARDAANTLAQRNGVNTQVSRLYKSFTDASNYTRSAWKFDANGVVLAGESAGTGDANISITLIPKGTGSVRTTGKIHPATDALAEQTATGILAGTGAPNNANGDNGDFYLRSDGGALTTIYQKRAGAWVGIV